MEDIGTTFIDGSRDNCRAGIRFTIERSWIVEGGAAGGSNAAYAPFVLRTDVPVLFRFPI